jgi:signal transduction histidine kinase
MPIIGTTQYLLERGENLRKEELEEIYNVIHISAQKVANLLENLLAWSRMQIGGMPYQPSPMDLTSLVERNINLFSQNAANKKITLQNHINQSVSVYADEHMLDTIIRNLLSNAIKFTPNGGTVTLSAWVQETPFVEVAVKDTGVGLNQEVLDNLLQGGLPQITMGTANEKGSGLGLMICREMIAHQGGQFWIEGESGCGTTVKFTVPREKLLSER